MNVNEMFQGQYLKALDYKTPKVQTIEAVRREMLGKDREEKFVMYLEGEKRGLVLNKTNTMAIAQMFGYETKEWRGKQIELYSTAVPFGNDIVDAIRVRLPSGFDDLEDIPA